MDIRELTESSQHDRAWLAKALQAAIELEFFTIPPYLTAMWSIVNQGDPAVQVLRSIIYEEMEHMAYACNLLLAIGGQPQINTPSTIPSYPNPMPGNVQPDLKIALRPFSSAAIESFMKIEAPEKPVEFPIRALEAAPAQVFSRIGELYTAIEDAFVALDKKLLWNADRQVVGPLANLVITNLSDARRAIGIIRTQGEGYEFQAMGADGQIAHYYRFQQYEIMRRLERDATAPKGFVWGASLSFPDVFPMAEVPKGGYDYGNVAAVALPHFEAFDRAYTLMLDNLQSTWGPAGQAGLYLAIEQMFELQEPARQLMQITQPGTRQTYGPHFRYDRRALREARNIEYGISR